MVWIFFKVLSSIRLYLNIAFSHDSSDYRFSKKIAGWRSIHRFFRGPFIAKFPYGISDYLCAWGYRPNDLAKETSHLNNNYLNFYKFNL